VASEVEYKPLYVNSKALVVGINEYADPRFPPLGNAEADARAMAKTLSSPRYQFEVTTLINQEATRQAVLGALFSLRSTGPDDRLIVYFAGHGYTLVDQFNHETGYLAAYDTVPEQDFTALQMDEVTDLRLNARAKHIAFIFDACFSGQALGLTRAAAVTSAEKFLVRRAYQIVSAGAGDQTVSDFRSMTTRLIEGLEGEALSEDGMITFSEVGLYLRDTVSADSGQTQIPQFGHIRGSQGGDFVFLLDTAPRLPLEILEAISSTRANTRMGAVVDLIEMARGDDETLARLARHKLRHIWQEDKDKNVRRAAQVFFYAGDTSGTTSSQASERRDIKLVVEREKPKALEAALDALGPDAGEMSDPEMKIKALAKEAARDAQEEEAERAAPQYVVDATGTHRAAESQAGSASGAEQRGPAPATKQSIKTAKIASATSAGPLAAIPKWAWIAAPLGLAVVVGGILAASRAFAPKAAQTPSTIAEATEAPTQAAPTETESPTEAVVGPATEAPTEAIAPTDIPAPTPFGGSAGPIVFVQDIGGNLELFTMETDGAGGINITNNLARDEEPEWSPDGAKLVFVSNRDGFKDVFVMNADGTGLINLSNNDSSDYNPHWSPDGTKIAFISERDFNPDVFIMNADGSQQTNITRSQAREASPTWSPDGLKLAYSALRGEQKDIFITNADGSGQINPTNNNSSDDIQPSWSPDGSKIAFVSFRDGNWELYVMAPNGGGVLRLTQEAYDDFNPSWSPDGAYILFDATIGGRHQLYRIRPDGSELTLIGASDSVRTDPSWRK